MTIAFNSVASISRTIDSVVAQTYAKIEYIVVDGGSTDGTLDLLRRRESDIDLWLSEPDGGISDAFNKGIALASGEFIALVNSDDWLEPQHAERAVEFLRRSDADYVFGNMMVHRPNGDPDYVIAGDPNYGSRIQHAMPALNHPSVVCRRRAYERCGLYDRNLRVAMDYEWLLRGHTSGLRGEYVPELTSHMCTGGVSHRGFEAGLREVRQVSVRYGYPLIAAWARFIVRIASVETRQLLERYVSKRLSQRLRALLHPGYRPCGADSSDARME